MANVFFTATTEVTPSADPQTIIQLLAKASHRVVIHGVMLGGLGSTPATAAPVYYLEIQTGTGSSSSLTLAKKFSIDTETLQTSALDTFSAEPSHGTRLFTFSAHQQSGAWFFFPQDERPIIVGNQRVGLVQSISSGWTAIVAELLCEE